MGNKNRKRWSLSEKLELLSHYQKALLRYLLKIMIIKFVNPIIRKT